jgi:hypothetical protein
MSYHRSRTGGRVRVALGDSVADKIKTIAAATSTAADVVNDPYLPETICRAQQLVAIENRHALPACANSPAGMAGGIGLRKLMLPLRGLVYAEQHRWVYPVAAVAAIGVPMALGYLLGKGSRR